MGGHPLRLNMNWSKNVYTFMLGAIIVLSGCMGAGTTEGMEEDDAGGTTVINNYYNNTTTIIPDYEVFAAIGQGESHEALITVNQSLGEGIHLLDASSSGWNNGEATPLRYLSVYTNCTNGMWWEIMDTLDRESPVNQWLAGTGAVCTHELQPYDTENDYDETLSVVFERRAVTVV